MDLYFVTSNLHPHLTPDDLVLQKQLATKGLNVKPLIWNQDPLPEDGPLFLRSTWDYYRHPKAFSAWLDTLEEKNLRVINPVECLKWNLNKKYLLDLEAQGLLVVPTILLEANTSIAKIQEQLQSKNWTKIVIKPAVSAGGFLTQDFLSTELEKIETHLKEIYKSSDALIQPYVADAHESGEVSLVFTKSQSGRMSFISGVKKKYLPGKYAIENEQANISSLTFSSFSMSWAYKILEKIPTPWFYLRLDLLNWNKDPMISEVEMIEPDLFFRLHESSSGLFAFKLLEEIKHHS